MGINDVIEKSLREFRERPTQCARMPAAARLNLRRFLQAGKKEDNCKRPYDPAENSPASKEKTGSIAKPTFLKSEYFSDWQVYS